MSPRARILAVALVCVVLLAGSAAYLLGSRATQQRTLRAAPVQPTMAVADVEAGPHVVFRNTAAGPHHGRVALVPLADPAGRRAITELTCVRVYAAAGRTACLGTTAGAVPVYRGEVVDGGGGTVALDVAGTPSRVTLSGEADLAATTSFVAGDSYASDGFSTRTVITVLATRKGVDLEAFRLVHRGKSVRPVDRNYWGVTFTGDGDTFYATAAFGGQTWLVRGSLRARTLTTLRADAECPSLSPDGRRVAYKKLQDRPPGDWRVAVLDLAAGTEVVLAEQRSVDDQVEWLDDDRLLYGVPRDDGVPGVLGSDVWVVPADGSGSPQILIRDASSPAVQR